ncbi:MAG TPA: hypothetical protein VFM75_10840 [Modicisalibacter sp.]|nr:hypothetical protein [Modicisalibacter sp.]
MFDIEDMLDDGLNHNEIWNALDACETAIKGMKGGGAAAVRNMIRSALDDIEMLEATGRFDE